VRFKIRVGRLCGVGETTCANSRPMGHQAIHGVNAVLGRQSSEIRRIKQTDRVTEMFPCP
jgi:hypothetical protein